jgi:hypothetical protein
MLKCSALQLNSLIELALSFIFIRLWIAYSTHPVLGTPPEVKGTIL